MESDEHEVDNFIQGDVQSDVQLKVNDQDCHLKRAENRKKKNNAGKKNCIKVKNIKKRKIVNVTSSVRVQGKRIRKSTQNPDFKYT